MAYSSNGEGTVTVVAETEPGKFSVASTIPTQPTARIMTLDPKSHRLYFSAVTVAPPPPGEPPQQGGGRRNYVPGSFVILVVGE